MPPTQSLGIIGREISYTLSPVIHESSAAHLGIPCRYAIHDIDASAITSLLESAWNSGALGFNVTTPHKSIVARLVEGHHLASVNTVFRGSHGWNAASTDGPGFDLAAARLGRDPHEWESIVILGSGGAVTGLLAHWANRWRTLHTRPPRVEILRRSPTADDSLRAASSGISINIETMSPDAFESRVTNRSCLIVQATSAPSRGDDLSEYAARLTASDGAIIDMVYARPSALVERGRALGIPTQDGLPMLIEQARLAQQYWWGRSASYEFIANTLAERRL